LGGLRERYGPGASLPSPSLSSSRTELEVVRPPAHSSFSPRASVWWIANGAGSLARTRCVPQSADLGVLPSARRRPALGEVRLCSLSRSRRVPRSGRRRAGASGRLGRNNARRAARNSKTSQGRVAARVADDDAVDVRPPHGRGRRRRAGRARRRVRCSRGLLADHRARREPLALTPQRSRAMAPSSGGSRRGAAARRCRRR